MDLHERYVPLMDKHYYFTFYQHNLFKNIFS